MKKNIHSEFSERFSIFNINIRKTKIVFKLLALLFLFPQMTNGQKNNKDSGDIIPQFECIKNVGGGKFEASFGYSSTYKNDITLSDGNNYLTSTDPITGKPISTFRSGTHNNAFIVEFSGSKLTWTIKLPNGRTRTVQTSLNASPCSTTGSIYPFYPLDNNKTDKIVGHALNALFLNPRNISDEIYLIENNYVLIEVLVLDGKYETLLIKLRELGLKNEVENGGNTLKITGWFPINKIDELNNLIHSIQSVSPISPLLKSGSVSSQGDKAQGSDMARLGFNLGGEGVKVGVISDSFDRLNGASNNVNFGDLPGSGNPLNTLPIDVKQEFTNGILSDEGRAMLQIVHDVAPKAELGFWSGFYGASNFALGIKKLEEENYDIIVDDITYVTEPFFQDGVLAQAVDYVNSKGVSYFSAAGNFGDKAYENNFVPISRPAGAPGFVHNFGGGDFLQNITLSEGTYTIVMQWDEPFYSLGQGGAQTDLDIYLANNDGSILYGFNRNNTGGDPVEIMPFTVSAGGAVTNLMIVNANNTENVKFKYIVFRGNLVFNEYNNSGNATIVGQANANGAISVGAALYSNSPPYGVNPPTVASFSSKGGTLVQGVDRNKPDIVAPNGVNTTVDLKGVDIEGDNIPNFFGTSASAPHAAGVAALLIEGKKKFFNGEVLSPTEVKMILQETAIDMDDPSTPTFSTGFDYKTGKGFIQAGAALEYFAAAAPVLREIMTPGGVEAGNTLTIKGEFFNNTTKIFVGGVAMETQIIGSDLTTTIPTYEGNPAIQVYNTPITPSGADGGFSNALYFFPKMPVTITVENKTKKWGDQLPAFTALVTKSIGDVTTTITLESLGLPSLSFESVANDLSDVDLYPIKASFSSTPNPVILDGLEVKFVDGILNIQKLDLLIKAKDLEMTYGDKIEGFDFEYIYQVNNDNPETVASLTGMLKEAHTSSILSTIGIVDLTLVENRVPFVNGTVYLNKSFLISRTAFVNMEQTLTSRTVFVNVFGDLLENEASLMEGTAFVSRAPFVNRATAYVNGRAFVNGTAFVNRTPFVNRATAYVNTSTFNSENNDATVFMLDIEDNEISELLPINVISGITAGKQWIVPAPLTSNNVNVRYTIGTLNILPKQLIIRAHDQYLENGVNPEPCEVSISGFVYDEDKSNLVGALICSTPDISLPGTYSITPQGYTSNNYEIVYEAGTIYVNPILSEIKAIRPILECIEALPKNHPSNLAYVAWMKYENSNKVAVRIARGDNNYLYAEGAFSGELPDYFLPGLSERIPVYFDGKKLTWNISTYNGIRNSAVASVASSTSSRCDTKTEWNTYYSSLKFAEENFSNTLNENNELTIKIYPNPVTHTLQIDLGRDNGSKVNIQIIDSQGKIIFKNEQKSDINNGAQVDVSQLSKGLYLIKVSRENVTTMVRIIKE